VDSDHSVLVNLEEYVNKSRYGHIWENEAGGHHGPERKYQ